jgi:hypothetical protein
VPGSANAVSDAAGNADHQAAPRADRGAGATDRPEDAEPGPDGGNRASADTTLNRIDTQESRIDTGRDATDLSDEASRGTPPGSNGIGDPGAAGQAGSAAREVETPSETAAEPTLHDQPTAARDRGGAKLTWQEIMAGIPRQERS